MKHLFNENAYYLFGKVILGTLGKKIPKFGNMMCKPLSIKPLKRAARGSSERLDKLSDVRWDATRMKPISG